MRTGLTARPRLRFLDQPAGAPTGTPSVETPPAPVPADPPKPTDPPKPGDQLGEPGLKALQAERDARADAEKALADLTKEIEDGKKSAEQKAAEALAAAQRDAADAALKALRYEAAATKGIDLKLASRLTGTTKAELEADADVLKSLIGTGATPRPDPSQGGGDGNVTGASVAAGRDLYAERHPAKTT